MVASYFFEDAPDFEAMGSICRWKKGYVVWEFPFFLWFSAQGGKVEFWDTLDYALWLEQGFEALKDSLGEGEYAYYVTNSHDLNALRQDIAACLEGDVIFHHQKPSLEILREQIAQGRLCTVVLDHAAIEGKGGEVVMHQMLVLDLTETDVICHNPLSSQGRAAHKIPIDRFTYAWLEAADGCLHAYSMTS